MKPHFVFFISFILVCLTLATELISGKDGPRGKIIDARKPYDLTKGQKSQTELLLSNVPTIAPTTHDCFLSGVGYIRRCDETIPIIEESNQQTSLPKKSSDNLTVLNLSFLFVIFVCVLLLINYNRTENDKEDHDDDFNSLTGEYTEDSMIKNIV